MCGLKQNLDASSSTETEVPLPLGLTFWKTIVAQQISKIYCPYAMPCHADFIVADKKFELTWSCHLPNDPLYIFLIRNLSAWCLCYSSLFCNTILLKLNLNRIILKFYSSFIINFCTCLIFFNQFIWLKKILALAGSKFAVQWAGVVACGFA